MGLHIINSNTQELLTVVHIYLGSTKFHLSFLQKQYLTHQCISKTYLWVKSGFSAGWATWRCSSNMVSVIQWGTTASSHETHGANHGLSTRDACIETERKTRLDKPQCYLSMPNRNQISSFANPCNDNGCHTLGRVLYVKLQHYKKQGL